MATTDAQKKASLKYKQKLEEVRAYVPKGEKEKIIQHAADHGETTSEFIRRAIYETIEKDNNTKS